MPEQKTIKCPICGNADITTLHTQGMMITKYGRASSNKKAINFYKDEKYQILSDRCPCCNASKTEIEKALKHGGRELTNDEVLKRLKEAGLDPSKLK